MALLGILSCQGDRSTGVGGEAEVLFRALVPAGVSARRLEAIQGLRVRALSLSLPDSTPGAAHQFFGAAGDPSSELRIIASIPPAELYRVSAEALGALEGREDLAGYGVLFSGDTLIGPVRSGDPLTIQLTLLERVPTLSVDLTPRVRYRLHWTQVDGARRYRLVAAYSDSSGPSESTIAGLDTTITFPPAAAKSDPTATSPWNGTRVHWRVRAEFSDSVASAYSESVGVTIPGPTPPAPVRDLTLAETFADSIVLVCTAPGDDGREGRATEYDLRRSTLEISSATWEQNEQVLGEPAPRPAGEFDTLRVGGLLPETRYYFVLCAIDDAGLISGFSNQVAAKTAKLPPAAPFGLSARPLSDHSIELTWSDGADNEDYHEVERRGPGDSLFVPRIRLPASSEETVTHVDDDLPDRTLYVYRVRTRNTGGPSDYSNEAEARTRIATPVITQVNPVTQDSLSIRWTFPSPDPGGFRLDRRTTSGSFREIARPGSAARSYGDGRLIKLTTYIYRIRAEQGEELSAYSNQVSGTTLDGPPVCHLDASSLDLGVAAVGDFTEASFGVRNTGGPTLVGSVSARCTEFEVVGGEGLFRLGSGEEHRVTVRFAPATPGEKTCSIRLGSTLCDTVFCRGLGEPAPACSLSATVLNFGLLPVGETADSTLVITNTGGGTLSGTPAIVGACPAFQLWWGAEPFELRAGETRTVAVRFWPQTAGAHSCTIDLGTGCTQVGCEGTGVSGD